ncbi:MAG: 4a-hydroxytetrahydrobiopterin dehydratase [Armatimonadota bacterium]
MGLSDEKCEPCHVGTPRLSHEEAENLHKEIPEWTLKDNAIEREYKFTDFREAINFINKVAAAAEEMDHHPNICNSYNKVRIELFTHKIGGLSRNDFVLAAKIDRVA